MFSRGSFLSSFASLCRADPSWFGRVAVVIPLLGAGGCEFSDVAASGAAGCGFASSARSPALCDMRAASGPETAAPAVPELKTADRSEVKGKLAEAAPDLAEFDANVKPPASPEVSKRPAAKPHKGPITLADAVASAVLSHPLMGAASAKVERANADLDYAGTAFKPTLSVNAGTGFAALGQYYNKPNMFSNTYLPGSLRTDLGLSFRQLVFDFGAAQEEVERNKALVDSEKLKLADQAEDIALRTVNAYFNLLEQRETLELADRTVEEEHKLAALVKLNNQNGNAATSDVDRINTKIFEIEATRSEVNSSYRVAMDEFRRLTGVEASTVIRPPGKTSLAPPTAEAAIKEARSQSPQILAIRAEGLALEHQMAEQEAASKPQVTLQVDGTVKNYNGVKGAAIGTLDNRAMFVMDYKIFDGGAKDAQRSRLVASQSENRFNELDQAETLELNIRRFYETIAADKIKRQVSQLGVETANKVNTSYIEQFKAGKRTIFEVLDSYTSIYNMRRTNISGEYESLRSQYGVLRNLGRLNQSIVGFQPVIKQR